MLYQSQTNANSHFAFKLKARSWCALVALITALAFISLVSTAVTHCHNTAQETQDCSLCGVVSYKITSNTNTLPLLPVHFFVLFALAIIALRSAHYVTASRLPPSCGPPCSR